MTIPIQPQVRYRTITPEEATVYLRRSKRKNVPTKKSKIDQYARDMLRGKWDPFNSQAVSIDINEDVVNGHQRLMACVQAGVPFRTLLVTGVPPESFATEDTGRSRDAGHFFAIKGEKYYVELASAARALYWWERGSWAKAAATSGGGNAFVPNDDLFEEVDRRPELRKAAAYLGGKKEALRGRFRVGQVGSLWVLTQDHPRHDAFWTELVDRLGADERSPAYQLNRRIDLTRARGAKLSALTLHALLTKAWNFYAAGSTTGLSWDPGKERMPDPHTALKPALLPPADSPAEVITTTPKPKRRKAPAGPPDLKVVPAPKPRKKGPKLRGGLDSSAG